MPHVKTTSYDGPERRNNGSSLKLSTGDWIRIGILGVSLFVSGITFYLTTNFRLNALAADTQNLKVEDSKLIEKDICQDKSITTLETNVESIKKTVEVIDQRQQEVLKIIYAIKGKIDRDDR